MYLLSKWIFKIFYRDWLGFNSKFLRKETHFVVKLHEIHSLNPINVRSDPVVVHVQGDKQGYQNSKDLYLLPHQILSNILEVLPWVSIWVKNKSYVILHSLLSYSWDRVARFPEPAKSSTMNIEQIVFFLDSLLFFIDDISQKITLFNLNLLIFEELILVNWFLCHIYK